MMTMIIMMMMMTIIIINRKNYNAYKVAHGPEDNSLSLFRLCISCPHCRCCSSYPLLLMLRPNCIPTAWVLVRRCMQKQVGWKPRCRDGESTARQGFCCCSRRTSLPWLEELSSIRCSSYEVPIGIHGLCWLDRLTKQTKKRWLAEGHISWGPWTKAAHCMCTYYMNAPRFSSRIQL